MPYNYIFGNIRLLSASVMNVGRVQITLWLHWQILMVVQFIPLEEDQQPNLTDPRAVLWFCAWLAGHAFTPMPAGLAI